MPISENGEYVLGINKLPEDLCSFTVTVHLDLNRYNTLWLMCGLSTKSLVVGVQLLRQRSKTTSFETGACSLPKIETMLLKNSCPFLEASVT